VLWRDVFVTGRNWCRSWPVVIQPFFMLFIFGKLLSSLGYVNSAAFAPILMAGIVALNGFLGGLQTLRCADHGLLVHPRSRTGCSRRSDPAGRGGEDVFGALRGIVAAVLMVPSACSS